MLSHLLTFALCFFPPNSAPQRHPPIIVSSAQVKFLSGWTLKVLILPDSYDSESVFSAGETYRLSLSVFSPLMNPGREDKA